jgi:hypothetical protein
VFFVAFILVSTFVVVNLFVNLFLAVVVNMADSMKGAEFASPEPGLVAEISALRQEVAALRGILAADPPPGSDPGRDAP